MIFPNLPGSSHKAIWFKLLGGLDALAIWQIGTDEGVIYADHEWLQNNPYDSLGQRRAASRAAEVTGADDIGWLFHASEELDRVSVSMQIPPAP